MEVIRRPEVMRATALRWRAAGRSIGFVPTMGNLHEGHLSLLRAAAADNDIALLSIYVNPLQFGPNEDLSAYPRTFTADLRQAASVGAVACFAPDDRLMYPPGFATSVEVAGLTEGLCGRSRPGHFRGVTTVVMKLLCLVLPDRAYFGEKDYQQSMVVARMVRDLGLGVDIVPCPTVREADGLALSSRNQYLQPAERNAALALSRALAAAQACFARGGEAEQVVAAARAVLEAEPLAEIDYVELVHPQTLAPVTSLVEPARLCLAARIGRARLIDNAAIGPEKVGDVERSKA